MSTYTIPYVVQQTPRGERTVDLYSRLLSDRIIYLGTEIDDGVANAVIAQLLHLASEAPSTPISLYINSPGGSITAMLAIYDAMQFVSSPVETTCVGQAAWTAAVLLAGGEPGRRQMLPHARVVLHQPAMSQRGTIPDLIVEADEVARVRTLLEEILAHHTGRSADQVREDTDRDLVLPGQAAVDYGIADAVLTSQVPTGVTRVVPCVWGLRGRSTPNCTGLDRNDRMSGGEAEGAVRRGGTGGADGELADGEVQGAGDGGEDLRGRVLEAALDLGEVLGRDARPLGHVGEALAAVEALGPQLAADELAPERLGPVGGRRLAHGLVVGTSQRQHLTHAATVGRAAAERRAVLLRAERSCPSAPAQELAEVRHRERDPAALAGVHQALLDQPVAGG